MKDKKGVLGFDTARQVLLSLLIIGVLVIAMILAISTLRDTAEETDTKLSGTINNETINMTGGWKSLSVAGYRNCAATVSSVQNSSNATDTIPTTNYSTSGCQISIKNHGGGWNSTYWNITYTYSYNDNTPNLITQNITNGSINFFKQIPTIFTLLGVVVIILVIAIVIVAVSRFGGGEFGMKKGGSSYEEL